MLTFYIIYLLFSIIVSTTITTNKYFSNDTNFDNFIKKLINLRQIDVVSLNTKKFLFILVNLTIILVPGLILIFLFNKNKKK